ncbi:MAG: respiratory nitrate reductase subunit gamma [Bacteroidota bacterium]|nr:respiratory nitrate reductase subunit gamma [Bacteroidota bacterium]
MSDTLPLDLDTITLVVLPYVAMTVFLLGSIQRYRGRMFTYSSLSSQFLENQQHFWALVPFHYGIIIILLGHLIGFLLPDTVLAWNSVPLRLYVLETTALIFGLCTLTGLVAIVLRRLRDGKVRFVTSRADWVVLAVLILQVFSGVYVALFHGWGSSWFASSATPYLWSLLTLSPSAAAVAAMPLFVKLHIVSAWILVLVFPFTRLVHVLVVPNHYLWRKPQIVRWYGITRGVSHE